MYNWIGKGKLADFADVARFSPSNASGKASRLNQDPFCQPCQGNDAAAAASPGDVALPQAASPPRGTVPTAVSVRRQLQGLAEQVGRLQRALRQMIEQELVCWQGRDLGSLEANQELAKRLHELVDQHGLRFRCPECGHAAILRCSARPGLPRGVFAFDHSVAGRRTFHGGGTTVPPLKLVAKPPRRQSGSG